MDLNWPTDVVLESQVEIGLLRPDGTVEWRTNEPLATPAARKQAEKNWDRHLTSLGLPPSELHFVSRSVVTVSVLHDGLLDPDVTINTDREPGAKFPRLDNTGKPLPL